MARHGACRRGGALLLLLGAALCAFALQAAGAPDAPAAAARQAELASLPVKELRALAKARGATAAQMEAAADSDDQKPELLALVAGLEAVRDAAAPPGVVLSAGALDDLVRKEKPSVLGILLFALAIGAPCPERTPGPSMRAGLSLGSPPSSPPGLPPRRSRPAALLRLLVLLPRGVLQRREPEVRRRHSFRVDPDSSRGEDARPSSGGRGVGGLRSGLR